MRGNSRMGRNLKLSVPSRRSQSVVQRAGGSTLSTHSNQKTRKASGESLQIPSSLILCLYRTVTPKTVEHRSCPCHIGVGTKSMHLAIAPKRHRRFVRRHPVWFSLPTVTRANGAWRRARMRTTASLMIDDRFHCTRRACHSRDHGSRMPLIGFEICEFVLIQFGGPFRGHHGNEDG